MSELAKSFRRHIKHAKCVWERSATGKFYSRPIEPSDIERWKASAARYDEMFGYSDAPEEKDDC
jgi:hypothetical protein